MVAVNMNYFLFHVCPKFRGRQQRYWNKTDFLVESRRMYHQKKSRILSRVSVFSGPLTCNETSHVSKYGKWIFNKIQVVYVIFNNRDILHNKSLLYTYAARKEQKIWLLDSREKQCCKFFLIEMSEVIQN